MYTQPRKLILFILESGIMLALGANSGAAAAGTFSQEVTDARQEVQIWTTYALSPYLRAYDLNVSVRNGKATLTGNVEEGVTRDLAKQIALGVNGVTEVDNQIVVQPDYIPPTRSSDRRYGEVIDDATISAAVKSKLVWSKYADGMSTEVDTMKGKVTLVGTADSGAARDLASSLAMNTRGVVSVDNQLVVTDTEPSIADTARNSAHDAGRDISDSWITTKVKYTLLYSSNVDSSDISVSTNSGIVTLSGKLNSGAERALAIELANNVRGVRSVQSTDLTI